MYRVQVAPHPHAFFPFLEKEVILEKLLRPPVVKEGSMIPIPSKKHHPGIKEQIVDNRLRERIVENEWHRPFTHKKTFSQEIYIPQRQYNSARLRDTIYPERQDDFRHVRKMEGVDRAFPLKPIGHKRTVSLRMQQQTTAHELERFPDPPPLDYLEYDEGNRKDRDRNGRPRGDLLMFAEENGNDEEARGYHRSWREQQQEQLCDEDRRMKMKTYNDPRVQEGLHRTHQEMQRRREKERAGSGDDTQREERHSRRREEQQREWVDDRGSPVEHTRWEAERRKEKWRRERSGKRQDNTLKDSEWQRDNKKDWDKDRRERKTQGEERERYERRDKETQSESRRERDRERKRPERSVERDRRAERERDNWKEIKYERNKITEKNERDMRLQREEKRNRHERERGYSKKWAEDDIDWDTTHRRERAYKERPVLKEDRQERDTPDKEQPKLMAEEDTDWVRKKRRERAYKERSVLKEERQERETPDEEQLKHTRRLPSGNSCRGKVFEEQSHPSASSRPPYTRLQQAERPPTNRTEVSPQLEPCHFCRRSFAADRLEKHMQICQKILQSRRGVFDSSNARVKGTELEEFMKTNPRSKTPQKTSWRQKHDVLAATQSQAKDGRHQAKPSLHSSPDYVTCPYCNRRFAPRPAERHIPMCQNIKSRPPPPPSHRRR